MFVYLYYIDGTGPVRLTISREYSKFLSKFVSDPTNRIHSGFAHELMFTEQLNPAEPVVHVVRRTNNNTVFYIVFISNFAARYTNSISRQKRNTSTLASEFVYQYNRELFGRSIARNVQNGTLTFSNNKAVVNIEKLRRAFEKINMYPTQSNGINTTAMNHFNVIDSYLNDMVASMRGGEVHVTKKIDGDAILHVSGQQNLDDIIYNHVFPLCQKVISKTGISSQDSVAKIMFRNKPPNQHFYGQNLHRNVQSSMFNGKLYTSFVQILMYLGGDEQLPISHRPKTYFIPKYHIDKSTDRFVKTSISPKLMKRMERGESANHLATEYGIPITEYTAKKNEVYQFIAPNGYHMVSKKVPYTNTNLPKTAHRKIVLIHLYFPTDSFIYGYYLNEIRKTSPTYNRLSQNLGPTKYKGKQAQQRNPNGSLTSILKPSNVARGLQGVPPNLLHVRGFILGDLINGVTGKHDASDVSRFNMYKNSVMQNVRVKAAFKNAINKLGKNTITLYKQNQTQSNAPYILMYKGISYNVPTHIKRFLNALYP